MGFDCKRSFSEVIGQPFIWLFMYSGRQIYSFLKYRVIDISLVVDSHVVDYYRYSICSFHGTDTPRAFT